MLKRDLMGPGVTAADVLRATDCVMPCFEIVDSRPADWKIGIIDTVADNASCGVFVIGEARADAAATIVANAVDVADARIVRAPARSVRDDSDLGNRLVTRHVPALPDRLVDEALDRGAAEARAQIRAGRIIAAVLALQGRWCVVGDVDATLPRIAAAPAAEPVPA